MPEHSQRLFLYDTEIYLCLPAGWSGTCALVFLFSKDATLSSILGTTTAVTNRAVGLIIPLAISHPFSSQFVQHLQWVAQTILMLQGQIDLLAATGY